MSNNSEKKLNGTVIVGLARNLYQSSIKSMLLLGKKTFQGTR